MTDWCISGNIYISICAFVYLFYFSSRFIWANPIHLMHSGDLFVFLNFVLKLFLCLYSDSTEADKYSRPVVCMYWTRWATSAVHPIIYKSSKYRICIQSLFISFVLRHQHISKSVISVIFVFSFCPWDVFSMWQGAADTRCESPRFSSALFVHRLCS